MSQVQLSLSTGALQIFSEDARLIETIPFYTDVQLSNVYIHHINNKLFYFIKLFKVTYKEWIESNSPLAYLAKIIGTGNTI